MRSIDELTKEFRLKHSKLCLDFLTYLRVYFLTTHNHKDINKPVLITVPSSLEFEKKIFDFAYKLLWTIKKQLFDRSIEDDEKDLANPNLSIKLRFIVILKRDHKIIVQRNIDLCKLVSSMLAEMITNVPIGQAIAKQYNEIETTKEQYARNRAAIRKYTE